MTRGLEGSNEDPPHWSRFFRVVDNKSTTGTTVMKGANEQPLLVLSREGEGRVGLVLSDQIWLWARGYEGGGPHIDLLRRLSHWLMKQPDLEEEALRLLVHGREITVQRQTMADTVASVTVTLPSGMTQNVTLDQVEPGVWRKTIDASELGLWRATDGKLTTLVNVGPANPREFSEVTSTTNVMAPLTSATGGDSRRLVVGSAMDVPRIVGVRSSDTFKGDDWIGLKLREASVVRGIGVLPMFAGLLGLLLLVGSLALTWAREGRCYELRVSSRLRGDSVGKAGRPGVWGSGRLSDHRANRDPCGVQSPTTGHGSASMSLRHVSPGPCLAGVGLLAMLTFAGGDWNRAQARSTPGHAAHPAHDAKGAAREGPTRAAGMAFFTAPTIIRPMPPSWSTTIPTRPSTRSMRTSRVIRRR